MVFYLYFYYTIYKKDKITLNFIKKVKYGKKKTKCSKFCFDESG